MRKPRLADIQYLGALGVLCGWENKTMSRFPIGFWNYVPIAEQDATAVQDWVEAGMTLAMGPRFSSASAEETAKMLEILNAAHSAGLQVILCPVESSFHHLESVGEATYRRDCVAAVAALGDHPAVSGFHVGDEPLQSSFAAACQAMRIQREIAPHLKPFMNLLPMLHDIVPQIGFFSYDAYLDAFASNAQPPQLCYDCYSQLNPDAENNAFGGGFEMYFRTMWAHREAAMRHGIDFWTTLLSVAHFRYRCPTEDDFRWQLNTAAAHGAKGILWFFFYMRYPHGNYRVSPIDEHGERTETFSYMSRVCRTFLQWQAPVLQECTLRRVSHFGKGWGGWPMFDGAGRVAKAVSSSETPLIFSEFIHANGAEYLAVVNNSQTESTRAELIVRGRRPNLNHVGWKQVESPLVDADGGGAEHGEDYIKFRCWLAPGQMEIYRVEES